MSRDVEADIAALMKRFRVQTDQGLADRLKLGRSTVTSWRRRGAVPEKYIRLTTENTASLPDLLSPHFDDRERNAIILAIMRLAMGFGAKITSYPAFLQHGPFLPAQLTLGMENAYLDLTARMEEAGIDEPRQALNLIVFEDYFSGK